MTEQIYIIGDVHGSYKTLMALVEKLPQNAKLAFTGDLIDRGPGSRDVINFVRDNNHLLVAGNHEILMVNACEDLKNDRTLNDWCANGGVQTLNNYENDEEQLLADARWLSELPRLIILTEYKDIMDRSLVLTHAPSGDYLNYYLTIRNKVANNDYSPHEYIDYEHTLLNSEELMIWNRNVPRKEQTDFFNVCGHNIIDNFIFDKFGTLKVDKNCITPENIVIDMIKGYANIDSGAFCNKEHHSKTYRGRLTALAFPSLEVIQQENIDGN